MSKKRASGEGGLFYIPSRDLWRGVVDAGFNTNGTRRQVSVTSRSRSGAVEKLKALMRDVEEFGAPPDRLGTVENWATHWLETVCRPKLRPKPFSAYQSIVRTWVNPVIGKKPIALVKPSDVRLVYQAIRAAGRSSSTALKAHNIMSAMFESARKDGIVARNVIVDVDAPRAAATSRDALSTEQAIRVLNAASERLDGTRWWLAILGGVRQGERLGATLDSLDLDRGLFTVQWSRSLRRGSSTGVRGHVGPSVVVPARSVA